jgi:hypothetical protein
VRPTNARAITPVAISTSSARFVAGFVTAPVFASVRASNQATTRFIASGSTSSFEISADLSAQTTHASASGLTFPSFAKSARQGAIAATA